MTRPRLDLRGDSVAVRLLAATAVAWIAAAALAVLWIAAVDRLELAVFPPLVATSLIGLQAPLAALARTVPRGEHDFTLARRRDRLLLLLGVLAWPHLFLRLRVPARERPRGTAAVWRALPRLVATVFLVAMLATIAACAAILAPAWPADRLIPHTLLWACLAAPAAAALGLYVRRLIQAEPPRPADAPTVARPRPVSLIRGSVLALAVTAAGACAAPLLAADVWLGAHARTRAVDQARTAAQGLLAAALPGREHELGRLLAAHPGASVAVTGTVYGGDDPTLGARAARTSPAAVVLHAGGVVVRAPVAPVAPPPLGHLVLLGALCLAAALGGTASALRDLDRDRARLRTRLHALLRGLPGAPPPPRSHELSAFSRALEAQAARLDELAVARYLGDEAARDRVRLHEQKIRELTRRLDPRRLAPAACARLDALVDLEALHGGRAPLAPRPQPLLGALARAHAGLPPGPGRLVHRASAGLPAALLDPARLDRLLHAILELSKTCPGDHVLEITSDDRRRPPALHLDLTLARAAGLAPLVDLARRPVHRADPPPTGVDLAPLALIDATLRAHGGDLEVTPRGRDLHLRLRLPAAPRPRAPAREALRIAPAAPATPA